MKLHPTESIDGFALRRRSPLTTKTQGLSRADEPVAGKFLVRADEEAVKKAERVELQRQPVQREVLRSAGLRRAEVDESLRALDNEEVGKARKKERKHFSCRGLPWRRVMAVFLALIVIGGAYIGARFFMASGRVFSGNVLDLLGGGTKLKIDDNGYTNILVFGTSEDDPGHADSGATLADSIMVLSVNQEKKTAAMISVPRDLYVKYGKACLSGYQGKINVAYDCGATNGDQASGAAMMQSVVSDVFGLDLQYYVQVNYSVLVDVVNSVGGVDVTIKSDDPRGILDRNFDWKCRYSCYYVKWPNGTAHLDGEQALALARARNANGGYGLGGGNFDREQYQQAILLALREKLLSAGTLANPVALTSIVDSLGDNVRTNFSASEVKTLAGLAKDIKSEDIKRISLVDEKKPVVTTGMYGDQSIVRPVAGLFDYTDVQRYVLSQLTGTTATTNENEGASIQVLNGSDKPGVASKKANELADAGFTNVTTGDTATSAMYGVFVWYDLSDGKMPTTAAKLKTTLGKAAVGTTLPSGVNSTADFVVIIGNGQ